VNLKKHFCFAKSASLVLQELRLKILLAQKAGDSSVGYASIRMTAVTENGMRKTENGICENSLFREF